jgi:hypothetical protein
MPTWNDVTRIGLALPATEVSTWYGTPGMKVAGKSFLRLRTEAEGGLVVLCDLDMKDALLRSGDPAFYTTPHYDGYGAILVNLKKVKRVALELLIAESWRRKAPSSLLAREDAETGGAAQRSRRPRARARKKKSRARKRR